MNKEIEEIKTVRYRVILDELPGNLILGKEILKLAKNKLDILYGDIKYSNIEDKLIIVSDEIHKDNLIPLADEMTNIYEKYKEFTELLTIYNYLKCSN